MSSAAVVVWSVMWGSVPSRLRTAHAVRLDLLLVAAGEVGPHRVRGEAPPLAPAGEVTSYVGVERVHEDLVGQQDVAVLRSLPQSRRVHQQRPGGHLLHVEHGADLAG